MAVGAERLPGTVTTSRAPSTLTKRFPWLVGVAGVSQEGTEGTAREDKAPGEGEGQVCIICDPCSGGAAFQSLADGSPVTVQMGQAVEGGGRLSGGSACVG